MITQNICRKPVRKQSLLSTYNSFTFFQCFLPVIWGIQLKNSIFHGRAKKSSSQTQNAGSFSSTRRTLNTKVVIVLMHSDIKCKFRWHLDVKTYFNLQQWWCWAHFLLLQTPATIMEQKSEHVNISRSLFTNVTSGKVLQYVALTSSLLTVSSFPTISFNFRGLYFSTLESITHLNHNYVSKWT